MLLMGISGLNSVPWLIRYILIVGQRSEISPEHIEKATEEDVKTFFREHYTPDNAIVGISGNIAEDKALKLVQKWFGDIPSSGYRQPLLPQEPTQTEARRLVLSDNPVPADVIYKVYHMGSRISENFYVCDVISDILSNGQSSGSTATSLRKTVFFKHRRLCDRRYRSWFIRIQR